MSKKKKRELHEWSVPYRVVLEGHVTIKAETAEEAEQIADSSPHDLDAIPSMTDWEVTGEATCRD